MTKAELEKENGKLEGKLADLQSEYFELENFKNNEIAELKKRNAELAGQKASLERWFGEAKEIVKKMLYEYQRLCLIKKETIVEAEQFSREVEK